MSAVRRPRILFVSHTAQATGPTASLRLLIEPLRERFDIGVVLPAEGPFTDALERLGVPYFPAGRLRKSAIPRLYRRIRGWRAALVYANNTSRASENALIAARLARVPFLCHVRGMSRGRGRRGLAFLRFTDGVVAVSRASATAVAPYVGPRPLHVVHNGVAPSTDRPSPTGARAWLAASLGIEPASLVVVGVANLTPRKAQHHAIRVWPRVLESHPEAHLLLAGACDRDPDYVARLLEASRASRVEHRVRLLGHKNDVDRILAAADVFVHTAVADPHPRAVLEAMAAGVPVIAFAVDGVAETVRDGETGRLIAVGDEAALARALCELLADPEARARLGAAGRRLVASRFSAVETARRVGDIIDRVLRPAAHAANVGTPYGPRP